MAFWTALDIGSTDSTSLSPTPNRSNTTFAPAGEAQPCDRSGISRFTNCIITCLWSDGVNRTPAILYSYNQLFRTNRKSTPTRDRQKFEFGELCKVWKIPMSRCVYVGKPKTETRTFVSESPSLVRLFFERYGVPKDCVIYSDNGKSFFEDGTSVLGELGFSKHLTYPACVHQFLSPNDNRHHGAAKAAWRNAGIEFTNDVLAAIRLLRFLDKDATAHSEEYFNRNLLLISEESSKTMINGRKMTKMSTSKIVYGSTNRLQESTPAEINLTSLSNYEHHSMAEGGLHKMVEDQSEINKRKTATPRIPSAKNYVFR